MFIIGISGGTASGKTTIAQNLKEQFGKKISIINCDNYYYSREELDFEQRKKINYDVPDSIDIGKILEDIEKLKEGDVIEQPIFSFKTLLREENVLVTNPAPILVIDGIFSLYFKELRELCNIKVYIDVDSEVRFARRLIRDTTIHNRPLDFIINQYLNMAKPMHDIYVEPYKKYADVIIPFYENNRRSVNLLISMIEHTVYKDNIGESSK